jgi:hypothetical protein
MNRSDLGVSLYNEIRVAQGGPVRRILTITREVTTVSRPLPCVVHFKTRS